MSTVSALIISGIFPALGIVIGALVDRRLDIIGVVVLAGLVVGTVLGLISHNARLYLLEGAVPSLVFALACLVSLRASKLVPYACAVILSLWTLGYGEHEKKKAEQLAAGAGHPATPVAADAER
jgi:hypothetical protein